MRTPLRVHALISDLLGNNRVQVLDVGARAGPHPRWLPLATLVRAYGIEPDQAECDRLNAGALSSPYPIRFLPCAVGLRDGQEATLHVCRAPGCSSLYAPNAAFCRQFSFGRSMDVVGEHRLTLTTLDTICKNNGLRPDALKIDIQGSELDALRGAGSVLEGVLAVELEVEFARQYRDQPLFHEIDAFMRLRGFQLVGLRRSYWRRTQPESGWPSSPFGGQLVHGDALYLKGALLDVDRSDVSMTDALKAVIALSAYSQDDLVVHILSTPHAALSELSLETRKNVARSLVTRRRSVATSLLVRLLRGIANRQLRALVDRLRPVTATDWHDPEFF